MFKKTLTLVLILLAGSSLFAQDYNLIEFKNKTGKEIYYLFFSPGDSGWWGPDVLGDSQTLSTGGSVEFYISYPEYSAIFDFLAVDEEGNMYEIYDIEISDDDEAKIVITDSDLTDYWDLTDLEEDLIYLEISNQTGFELYHLFISPSDSEMYGIDFMDSVTTLPSDESKTVVLFQSNAEIGYDIMGMDDEGDTYSFSLTLDSDMKSQYTEITLDDID